LLLFGWEYEGVVKSGGSHDQLGQGRTKAYRNVNNIDIYIYLMDDSIYQQMLEHEGSMLLPNLARWWIL
jgi:hypothetical protein